MEIFRQKFNELITSTGFNVQDYIDFEHDQDCCENVYIDFEHLDNYRKQIDELKNITEMSIKGVEGEGIVVFLYNGENERGAAKRVGMFLACRNEQNGYYSDELKLIVNMNGNKTTIDLRDKKCDCVLDDIEG